MDKAFEEWWEESLKKIPVYTKEWTNFNPSDPGVTILEYFIAFHLMQQKSMDGFSQGAVENLLGMAGIIRRPGACARVLLKLKQPGQSVLFPAYQQFWVGETVFETEKPQRAGGHKLVGVYGMAEEKILDGGVLLQEEIPMSIKIFGDCPKAGNAVYFIMDSLPEGEEFYFYVDVVKTPCRNDFEGTAGQRFAEVSWQCYTREGFQEISCKDQTAAFLTQGELVFSGIQGAMVYSGMPESGYCIRGVLKEASYDIVPQLLSVHGFLLEAFQHKTGCAVKGFGAGQPIELDGDLLENGYFRVYCREEEGNSYRRYESNGSGGKGCYYEVSQEEGNSYCQNESDGHGGKGRYYEVSRKGEKAVITFNKRKFGYGPAGGKDAARLVVYTEEMMKRSALGMVYGYDNQLLQLPVSQIAPRNFCLLAKRQDRDGDCYDFVKPGRTKDGDLKYELLEEEGRIRILDAGDFVGAQLFLAGISTCQGEAGNVRADRAFFARGAFGELELSNPAPGMGGRQKESLKMAARRLYEEVKEPQTAVCARDYERMAQRVPGLCIHKVRVVMDEDKNEILAAVKPWSKEPFPGLTPLYQNVLETYFEPRRLLGASICFLSPRYVAVDVRGVIYVKRHYEHCREEIEHVIKKFLDYRAGSQEFGEILKIHQLYWELERLDCIVSVQNLGMYPQDFGKASVHGMDVHPAWDCLCYPGNLSLDIHAGQPGGYGYE